MNARIPGWEFLSDFHDVFNAARVGLVAITTSTTQWLQFGRFQCPAGLAFGMGYGDMRSMEAAPGRIHINLRTVAPANIDGMIRIVQLDPQLSPIQTCWQGRSDDLRLGAADPTIRAPFAEDPRFWISQDFSFSFEVLGDAAQLVAVAASTILVSMTQARVRRAV